VKPSTLLPQRGERGFYLKKALKVPGWGGNGYVGSGHFLNMLLQGADGVLLERHKTTKEERDDTLGKAHRGGRRLPPSLLPGKKK